MSFRNRYLIAGANGIIQLTIPLKGGREQKKVIKEVQIDYTNNWNTIHWRSIESSYHKAPFFEYYAGDIHRLLFEEENFLFDLNIKILKYLYKILAINVILDFTDIYFKDYPAKQDLRNYWLPRNYTVPPRDEGIRYSQVFEDRFGFQPNLSILDLIFCEGPNATNYLTNSVKYR